MIIAMNNGTVYEGNLVVPNKDDLKEIRDALMQYHNDVMEKHGFLPNYSTTKNDLMTFRDILSLGYFKDGNQLVHNYINKEVNVDEIVNYTKEVIRSNYLSSILLFTSLLGELDATDKESIVQQFIGMGIYKCIPFEKMWNTFNREMVVLSGDNRKISNTERNIQLQNLKIFRAALRSNIIQFEVENEFPAKEYEKTLSCREYSFDDRYRIGRNSELLFHDLKKIRSRNSKVS